MADPFTRISLCSTYFKPEWFGCFLEMACTNVHVCLQNVWYVCLCNFPLKFSFYLRRQSAQSMKTTDLYMFSVLGEVGVVEG